VLACTIPVLVKLNPKNLIHIILGGKKRKKRINSEAFTNSHEVSNPFAVKDERRFFCVRILTQHCSIQAFIGRHFSSSKITQDKTVNAS